MMKIILSAIIGICVGLAAAAYFPQPDEEFRAFIPPEPVEAGRAQCSPDQDLEVALFNERDTTHRLIDEIGRLEAEIESLSKNPSGPLGGQAWVREAWAELSIEEPDIDRRQQLVDGGFDPSRAGWLAQRESELQMSVTNDSTMPLDHLETRLRARQALRAEIGDFEYEQYLAATGQSTAVAVRQVFADSPAEAGGLQVGDEIVDYDGIRVFNVFELSDVSASGPGGDSVVVNIERDGAPMQLVLPRGTLGISAGKPMP